MASSLTITNIDAGYGAVRVLEDVSLIGRRRRDGGAARHQRQRQVDPDEVDHGHGAAVGRHASPRSIDGTSYELVGRSTEEIVDLGIGFVPEGRRLFPKLTVTENLLLGAFRPTARSTIAAQPRLLLRDLPAAQGAGQAARRLHERRRAADAGARPRADVGAAHPADRRAVGRAGAAPGPAHHRQDQGAEGGLSTSPC